MTGCLGLEWSTRTLSVGLRMEGHLTVRTIEVERFNAREALDLVTTVFNETSCTEKDLHEIRLGRGPGNYTGIRQSIALAIGLAAPSSLPIYAVNSGSLTLPDTSDRWVMGDARRGMWWGAHFPSQQPDWLLAPPEEWEERLSHSTVCSAEPERLHSLEARSAAPSVSTLLQLPAEYLNEPVEPLYLHQAV